MPRFVALLRGINVGGHNRLAMADLREAAREIGWADPQSYIQSGNLVFEAENPHAEALQGALQNHVPNPPLIIIRAREEFLLCLERCPFESQTGKDLHLYFFDGIAKSDDAMLNALQVPSERWALGAGVFYLFAPDGIARSKLALAVDQALGVQATARNWNTCGKLRAML